MLGLGRALGETIAVYLIISPDLQDQLARPADGRELGGQPHRPAVRRRLGFRTVGSHGGGIRTVRPDPDRELHRLGHRGPIPVRGPERGVSEQCRCSKRSHLVGGSPSRAHRSWSLVAPRVGLASHPCVSASVDRVRAGLAARVRRGRRTPSTSGSPTCSQYGMRVNYTADGSSTGRQDFINGTDRLRRLGHPVPDQPRPTARRPRTRQPGSYAYMPITAGGTVFMYNLRSTASRSPTCGCPGENIAKIFTGAITNWDDPAMAADNPGLKLPEPADRAGRPLRRLGFDRPVHRVDDQPVPVAVERLLPVDRPGPGVRRRRRSTRPSPA